MLSKWPVLAYRTTLKLSGAIFRPISSKVSVQKVLLCPFNCKLRPSEGSLASPGIENIRQLPRNRAEVGQNYDARKAVSATLSVLKWSRALFRPRSSTVSAAKNLLCLFHWKPRPSGVSLESPGLQYISQVPENGEDVGQNHDARRTVLASLSVLKRSGKFCCINFNANEGHQGLLKSLRDWKISPKFREILPKLVKITVRVRRSRLLFQSWNEVRLYSCPGASKWAFKKFLCVYFTANQSHQELV